MSCLSPAAHKTNSHDGRERRGTRIVASISGSSQCLAAGVPFRRAAKSLSPASAEHSPRPSPNRRLGEQRRLHAQSLHVARHYIVDKIRQESLLSSECPERQ